VKKEKQEDPSKLSCEQGL